MVRKILFAVSLFAAAGLLAISCKSTSVPEEEVPEAEESAVDEESMEAPEVSVAEAEESGLEAAPEETPAEEEETPAEDAAPADDTASDAARQAAQDAIDDADARITRIENTGADRTYPDEYNAAVDTLIEAEDAFDAADYEAAKDYAALASEIASGIEDDAKSAAQADLDAAEERVSHIENIGADRTHPDEYNDAVDALIEAEDAFDAGNYEAASDYASRVLEYLAEVDEAVSDTEDSAPLPKYYVVRTWERERDCFWNIAARPYVYNNPWLWEKLYSANKDALPDPDDPDVILPGMQIEIPSAAGEERSGTYSEDAEYEPLSAE